MGAAGGGYSFWDRCRVCCWEVGGSEIGVMDLEFCYALSGASKGCIKAAIILLLFWSISKSGAQPQYSKLSYYGLILEIRN